MRKLASPLALAAAVLALGAAPAHAQHDDGMIAVPTLVSLPVLENLTDAVQDSTKGSKKDRGNGDDYWINYKLVDL
ncbi:hypothetical protein HNR06_004740 [Nocardiopsis arvandica]|uniref:Uncharacterized protein n=1 Tax=Nocardiopsis sinuspersici TaxID=501010 RepID=A0A7Y9XG22_9ACTN|nr:hypothetical protein [Nocardiopsis sinuspersici]NYH55151.1 hypothetical protein [Nocardiopsis sinuspersici]